MNLADRAYMEEVSRLAQQKDPYGFAYGAPSAPAANAQMADSQMPGAKAIDNLDVVRNAEAAGNAMTGAAERAEAGNLLMPQSTLAVEYNGFPGKQNVAQSPEGKFMLDQADAVLALLQQSRNAPRPGYRGNAPNVAM